MVSTFPGAAVDWPGAGVTALPNGQVVLDAPASRLAHDLDRALLLMADLWQAHEESHPVLIDAHVLERLDYFSSFPHLVTLPVTVDDDEANLEAFRAEHVDEVTGAVRLSRPSPIHQALTPAACYHVYPHHEGQSLPAPLFVTTRNTCFRRESHYQPLRRQWSFEMREIVCLGTAGEVESFLDQGRNLVSRLCAALDLDVAWEAATDPFFRPSSNPRYLMQRVEPLKLEARLGDGLAIASLNLHHDHFGSTFGIRRGGRPAVTGCLAFGLDRWLFALIHRHGAVASKWPDVVAGAERVAAGMRASQAAGAIL